MAGVGDQPVAAADEAPALHHLDETGVDRRRRAGRVLREVEVGGDAPRVPGDRTVLGDHRRLEAALVAGPVDEEQQVALLELGEGALERREHRPVAHDLPDRGHRARLDVLVAPRRVDDEEAVPRGRRVRELPEAVLDQRLWEHRVGVAEERRLAPAAVAHARARREQRGDLLFERGAVALVRHEQEAGRGDAEGGRGGRVDDDLGGTDRLVGDDTGDGHAGTAGQLEHGARPGPAQARRRRAQQRFARARARAAALARPCPRTARTPQGRWRARRVGSPRPAASGRSAGRRTRTTRPVRACRPRPASTSAPRAARRPVPPGRPGARRRSRRAACGLGARARARARRVPRQRANDASIVGESSSAAMPAAPTRTPTSAATTITSGRLMPGGAPGRCARAHRATTCGCGA